MVKYPFHRIYWLVLKDKNQVHYFENDGLIHVVGRGYWQLGSGLYWKNMLSGKCK